MPAGSRHTELTSDGGARSLVLLLLPYRWLILIPTRAWQEAPMMGVAAGSFKSQEDDSFLCFFFLDEWDC